MNFKLDDGTRSKLVRILNKNTNNTKLANIRHKLLTNKEVELTDTEVSELILLGLRLND